MTLTCVIHEDRRDESWKDVQAPLKRHWRQFTVRCEQRDDATINCVTQLSKFLPEGWGKPAFFA